MRTSSYKVLLASIGAVVVVATLSSSAVAQEVDPLALPSSGTQHPSPEQTFIPVPQSSTRPLDETYLLQKDVGNSNWGGIYSIYQHVESPHPDDYAFNTHIQTEGRLFGTVKGFMVVVNAFQRPGGDNAGRVWVRINGTDVSNELREDQDLIGIAYRQTHSKSLGSASKSFPLGPLSVTVSGSIVANAALDHEVNLNRPERWIRTIFRPAVNLTGSMSASVSVPLASAGIRGDVTLIELSPEGKILFKPAATGPIYYNKLDILLRSLQGKLTIFASLLGASWSKVILDWPGIVVDKNLLNIIDRPLQY